MHSDPCVLPGPVVPASNRRRAGVALGVAGLLVGGVVSAMTAQAAVPTFPDNLVVFPDRDFVTVEGFQDHLGETATLQVVRGGTVVGSAKAVVQAGDVAFEVNHPGGACWGAGTTLKVTPDIVAGDRVTIAFPDGTGADTTVQDAAVDADPVQDGSTVRVTGHVAAGVNRAQLEQRIVNPDLSAFVGKRDVRAVPGPVVSAPGGAYQSGLDIAADGSFTATYIFTSAQAAQVTAGSPGARLMSWQLEDGAANRQGLSIAEFGEAGGPGMGGCPAGPSAQAAPAGSFSAVRSADGLQAQVNWTAATPQPGAAAVTGYNVLAIAPAAANGQSPVLGARTPAAAARTTLTGLTAGTAYTFEVRSLTDAAMSAPFKAISTVTPPADQTAPPLTLDPAPSNATTLVETDTVTAASETGADIYYAVGTSAITGDLPSDDARLYTGPIAITATTELHFAAFDRAGNSATAVGTFTPPTAAPATLAGPDTVTATPGQESATVRWSAVTSATGYRVTAKPAGAALAATTVETTALTTKVSGLTAGTSYTITVATRNSAGTYGNESTLSATVTPTPVTDQVTVTLAKWRSGDFNIKGTGSAAGATVSIHTGSATGPVIGTAVVAAPVAPATVGDYALRLRNNAAGARNPGQIWATSSNGGVVGPVTVTNG